MTLAEPNRQASLSEPEQGAPYRRYEDEEVVAKVLDGETELFEIVMRRYNERLFRVARSILGNDDEAEDVMQEAYFRAFAKLAQFRGKARFSTWLTKIAVYEALRRRRVRGRWQWFDGVSVSEEPLFFEPSPTPEVRASSGELRGLLEEAVSELSAPYRAVFVLRQVEGLSTAETASVLGTTSGAVKVRLHRARKVLQSAIDRRLGEETRQLFAFGGERCDRVVATVLARLSASEPVSTAQ